MRCNCLMRGRARGGFDEGTRASRGDAAGPRAGRWDTRTGCAGEMRMACVGNVRGALDIRGESVGVAVADGGICDAGWRDVRCGMAGYAMRDGGGDGRYRWVEWALILGYAVSPGGSREHVSRGYWSWSVGGMSDVAPKRGRSASASFRPCAGVRLRVTRVPWDGQSAAAVGLCCACLTVSRGRQPSTPRRDSGRGPRERRGLPCLALFQSPRGWERRAWDLRR